jgi:hypothetical protein
MLTVPKIQSNLLESAILEILLIFPTSKIFHYHEKGLGFINLIEELSNKNPNIQIKIMAPGMHNVRDAGDKLKEQYPKNIETYSILHISPNLKF